MFYFSLFEETALCYLNILPSRLYNNNGVELNCTAHDIAPALSAATEINYDIQLQYLPTNTPAQQIFFDECEGRYFMVRFRVWEWYSSIFSY